MNKQHLALIFLVVLVPYVAYAFRSDIIGADGYLYLLHVCGKDSFVLNNPINANLVVAFIYSLIPCSVLAAKVIMFVLAFASALLLYKIAELYVGQDAIWAAFFAFGLSQLFFFSTVYFEPQQFSMPLLLASLFFYLKGKKVGNVLGTNYKIVALGLLLPAGMIWKGSIVLLFAYSIAFLPALCLAIVVLAWQGLSSLVVFLPSLAVQENFPLVGFAALAFLLLGYKYRNNYGLELALLSVFAVCNSKFAFLLVPFLCVGVTQFVLTLNEKQRTFIFTLAIMLFLLTVPRIFLAQPTTDDWKAINFVVSQGKPIQNDWDVGYWLAWAGGTPSSYGGGDYNNLKKEGVLLTQFNQSGCTLLKRFATKSVWQC